MAIYGLNSSKFMLISGFLDTYMLDFTYNCVIKSSSQVSSYSDVSRNGGGTVAPAIPYGFRNEYISRYPRAFEDSGGAIKHRRRTYQWKAVGGSVADPQGKKELSMVFIRVLNWNGVQKFSIRSHRQICYFNFTSNYLAQLYDTLYSSQPPRDYVCQCHREFEMSNEAPERTVKWKTVETAEQNHHERRSWLYRLLGFRS